MNRKRNATKLTLAGMAMVTAIMIFFELKGLAMLLISDIPYRKPEKTYWPKKVKTNDEILCPHVNDTTDGKDSNNCL